MKTSTNNEIIKQLSTLYKEIFAHDGYGDIKLEMRILRRGQKEIIIYCGKQYRYIVDYNNDAINAL